MGSDVLETPEAWSRLAIAATGLTRRFGRFEAVKGLELTVPAGTFYGFLGPNGAGKSTAIRMMTGLLDPTLGDCLIHGRSIRNEAVAAKRLMGSVPDDLALFDHLSLLEHLTLVGRIYGLTAAETDGRARHLLELLGLWEQRATHAVDASHGMRKKLALGMALLPGPRVLFLDEPFEGVDPVAAMTLKGLLRSLGRKGVTIFMTSHILEIVEQLVDVVGVIHEGRLVTEKSLEQLRSEGGNLRSLFHEAVGATPIEEHELPWLL